jgi:alanine dehydrogenase
VNSGSGLRGGKRVSQDILMLTPRDVRSLLSLDVCILAVEEAFRLYGEGKAAPPGVLGMHTSGGGFHIKAGFLQLNRDYFAAKVNGNFPGNPAAFGLPTIQGIIVLCDADNGRPLAVMDSIEITGLRTAAATAVAAKHLATSDSQVITICGCGRQGRMQLLAVAQVCDLRQVFAFDIEADQATRFARELGEEIEMSVEVVSDLAAAVRKSHICVTCTTSDQPILGAKDVAPGTFIAAVGADNPEKQELHPDLMAKAKVVVDLLDQCASMGDLHHAIEAGSVTKVDVHAELGEIVAGKKPGRTSSEEIVIFDSTGMALQDVAVAAIAYENAERQGRGFRLDFAA